SSRRCRRRRRRCGPGGEGACDELTARHRPTRRRAGGAVDDRRDVGDLSAFHPRRTSMSYVDGFVVPVPVGNKEAYLKASRKMTAICTRLGATRMVECWGDDVP